MRSECSEVSWGRMGELAVVCAPASQLGGGDEALQPSILGGGDKGSCLREVELLMLPPSSAVESNQALRDDAGPIVRAIDASPS